MKIRTTPFLILAIGLFFYAIYTLLFKEKDIQGYRQLDSLLLVGVSAALLIIYGLLRAILKTKVRIQVIIEVILLLIASIAYYNVVGEFVF